MASVWKRPGSPYFYACYTDETGRQLKTSTKIEAKESKRRAAEKVAEDYEEAAKLARSSELTQAAALKVLNDIMKRTGQKEVDVRSIKDHFMAYRTALAANGAKVASLKRYEPILKGFVAHLGEGRANGRLASVTTEELEAYRDAEIQAGKSAATAAFALKVLNGVFEEARRKASILHNPIPDILKRTSKAAISSSEERRPFTDSQVSSLLQLADEDWQGMILFAYHTGIRLNDAAALSTANIDGKLLRFREAKTAHRKKRGAQETVVVMAEDLREFIHARQYPSIQSTPLFPSLHGRKPGGAGGLSNAFAKLLEKAAIDRVPGDVKSGKGRRFNALSFHSLRHTMISRLANSDVPTAVAKAMSGHTTDEAHRRYVHLEIEAQSRAVEKAPRIWKQGIKPQ